jgi:peptide/nickel transport system substrate-binding protein
MRHAGKKARVAIAAGTAAIAGVAALAGCGSSGTSGTSGSSGSHGTAATLTIPLIGSGAATQADFNPFLMGTQGATFGTDLLYLPLAAYNSLTGGYIPYLAAAAPVVVSAKQVEFTLRSGVTWSNGTPVTAADVAFSFGILKKYPAIDTSGIWQVLQSVTTSGSTVTFTLKAADSQAAVELAQVPIVPQSAWSAVGNPSTYLNGDPTVVDGPYELQAASSVKVVWAKNPKYFGIKQMGQAPDTVTGLPQAPGATQVLDLEKGVYDWNETNDSDQGGFTTDWVAKNPSANKYWLPPAGLITMYLNQAKAPFNDQKFRLALDYGISRAAVSKHANVNGYDAPATQTGLLPSHSDLIPASVPDQGNVPYDPAKARQLLLSDGYHYSGSKLIGKNGQQVSFTLQTVQGFVDWLGEAEEAAAELGNLGIAVTVSQVQITGEETNLVSGQYDAALFFTGLTGVPYSDYQSLLASYLTAPVGQPAGGDDERLHSPQADGLLNQVASSTSTAVQNAALGQLASYVYNQVPVIELTYTAGWYEYSTKNYTNWPDAANPYGSPISVFAQLEIIPQLKVAK